MLKHYLSYINTATKSTCDEDYEVNYFRNLAQVYFIIYYNLLYFAYMRIK